MSFLKNTQQHPASSDATSINSVSAPALRILKPGTAHTSRREEFAARMHLTLLAERLTSGSRVLDFGCGAAATASAFFSQRNFETFSSDTSEQNVARAKFLAPRATFLIGTLAELDFPEDFFDLIFSQTEITAMDRDAQLVALRHLANLLRPAALLVAGIHSDQHPSTLDDLIPVARAAGLTLVDVADAHYWFAKT